MKRQLGEGKHPRSHPCAAERRKTDLARILEHVLLFLRRDGALVNDQLQRLHRSLDALLHRGDALSEQLRATRELDARHPRSRRDRDERHDLAHVARPHVLVGRKTREREARRLRRRIGCLGIDAGHARGCHERFQAREELRLVDQERHLSATG